MNETIKMWADHIILCPFTWATFLCRFMLCFYKRVRCRDEGHLDKLCSRVSSASCRTVGLVLTSWGGRRPSARQQSPASAPRGRRCRCRSLDTRSSPARLTHTGETGRSKIRWKSREREASDWDSTDESSKSDKTESKSQVLETDAVGKPCHCC